jgi:hypothetical protein
MPNFYSGNNGQGQGLLDEAYSELALGNAAVHYFSEVDEEITIRSTSHGQGGMVIALTRMTLSTASLLVESFIED